MTRKFFLFALLAVALATALLFPFANSNASRAVPDKGIGSPQSARTAPLPDYDVRLAGKGEFTDFDLSSASARSAGLNVAVQARAAAVARFQSRLNSDVAQKLRAKANETGAIKNLFVEGATLSEPQSDTADNIARGFLARNTSLLGLRSADASNLKLINQDNDRGTTFLQYAQTVGGLKVFEGGVQVAVNRNGEVLSVREGFLVDGQTADLSPAVGENDAIVKAFANVGRSIDSSLVETRARGEKSESASFANPLGTQLEDVLSELNVLRVGNSAKLAWHIYAEIGPDEWYESLVDAHSGELLLRHNLYVFDAQGTVYTEAPDKGARQLVSFVGDTVINTSFGWMGTATVTTGNNVEAYLDTNADNAPDNNNGSGLSVGHASSATQDFTFPFSTAVDPRTQQAAVVTNLFYYNNVMHDFSYTLGFTETSGNFQTNNYGRGGIGNDSVRAEAQDGSGTNNANFATPPDGQRPRMQQYLFTSPNPDRDSSVDGDVVFHEFGHGISNRLIGNGSTALQGIQSGAMGEGWSDYWAITINNDGAVGEYVTNNPIGIRRAVYSVPAATVHDSYADVCFRGCEVHKDGEVWAAALWDLRTQLGAATSDLLVLNGMKFTPIRPSFLDARDGIIQADQNMNGGANFCAIWVVFARHGMGVSASGNDGHQHNAATDVPPGC
ncbi:MAG TPA: extracellular metalloproteinase [Pyrinomonadaceae bacterium]|nr:extracellular metalloproteinase [Pyrinomonadaceae bacterium]